MKVYCCVCGRQVVYNDSQSDGYVAPGKNPKANFYNTVFCDECGEDLDENGMFPEEAAMASHS